MLVCGYCFEQNFTKILDESLIQKYFIFTETEALWIFFIGPIGLLLCFNLGLLMYASFQIIKIKRDTKALKNDDSRIRYRKRHVKRLVSFPFQHIYFENFIHIIFS